MERSKQEINQIKYKLVTLEDLEHVVESSIQKCQDLSSANACFLRGTGIEQSLGRLSRVIKDNIASIGVVLNLLTEYHQRKDETTGMVQKKFQKKHSVLTYGVQSLQNTNFSLEQCCEDVYTIIKMNPFLESFLRELLNKLSKKDQAENDREENIERPTKTTLISNIDDLFGDSPFGEDGNIDTIDLLNPCKEAKTGKTFQGLRKEGKLKSGIKLSDALVQEKLSQCQQKRQFSQKARTYFSSEAIIDKPLMKTIRSSNNGHVWPSNGECTKLPPLKPTSRMMSSSTFIQSKEEKSLPTSIRDLICSHRERKNQSDVLTSRSHRLGGLMSKRIIN